MNFLYPRPRSSGREELRYAAIHSAWFMDCDTGGASIASRLSMHQLLISMRLTCDCAFSLFGKVTVSTPFLKRASTSSCLTS